MSTLEPLTHLEYMATLEERFGKSPYDWAFQCPGCDDIATGREVSEALKEFPRNRKGVPVVASDVLGQECIGRTLGALSGSKGEYRGRGCDWCAFGLFPGPQKVIMPDGHEAWSFPIAPAPVEKEQVDA